MPAAAIKTAVRVLVIPLEPADEPYAIIPLHGKYGQGKVAKVSLQDVARLRRYRWYSRPDGYAVRYVQRGKSWGVRFMHLDILPMEKGLVIDHINRDRCDYRRSNLRAVTQMHNNWNTPKARTNPRAVTKSRFKGVKLNLKSGTWNARITVNKETHPLGGYSTEEEAARAYDVAARYYFGEHGVLNFDEGGEALSASEIRERNRANRDFTSSYVGVYWNKKAGKWYARAYITPDEEVYLGLFSDEREAAKAVDDSLYLKGLARINFPNDSAFRQEPLPRLVKSSPYRGVTWHKKSQRWYATVAVNGKTKHVGVAKSEEAAARMADDARATHGLPRVNFPDQLQAA